MKRIPPSRKLRQEFEEVLQGYECKGHPLDAFVTLGARYMLQVALEQEVEDFLGRAHYKRGKRKHQGWRNGYEEGKVTTAEGLLQVALPRVRETEEPKVILRFPTESSGLRVLQAQSNYYFLELAWREYNT